MTRFLAYTAPATGHLNPLVPGLLELRRRGHEVHVRTLASMVETLRALGLEASAVAPEVAGVEVTDYQATTDTDRLTRGQVDLVERGRHDGPDLERAIAEVRPDALLVDAITYGALTRAEASGIPTALVSPSVVPVPGRGIPPYGLGLPPMRGPIGAVRDAVLWKVVERAFGKAMLPGLNMLRAEAGLAPFRSPLDQYAAVDAVIVLAGEPIEYPRRDLPEHVHLVGAQPWDTAGDPPDYLLEPGDPWVLVTCSTDYQGDEDLARVAVEALAEEPVRVLMTLADAYDTVAVPERANVRVERFVSHSAVLPHVDTVVCHGGMGIVGKAMAAGVPMVVVPFGRDQPEIARRVVVSGAGVSVKAKKLTTERLRDAVRVARGLRDGASQAADTMAAHDAAAAFADAALTLAARDGSGNGAPRASTAR